MAVRRSVLVVTLLCIGRICHAGDCSSCIPPSEPKWNRESERKRIEVCAKAVGEDRSAIEAIALKDPSPYRRWFAAKVLAAVDKDVCNDLFYLGDQALKTACLEEMSVSGQPATGREKEHLLRYLKEPTQYEWTKRFFVALCEFVIANQWEHPDLGFDLQLGILDLWGVPRALEAASRLPGQLSTEVLSFAVEWGPQKDSNNRKRIVRQGRCRDIVFATRWFCKERPDLTAPLLAASRELGFDSCKALATRFDDHGDGAILRFCYQTTRTIKVPDTKDISDK